MPLRDHLRELRRRLLVSALAIVVGVVGGWFLATPVLNSMILHPAERAIGHGENIKFVLNTGVAAGFNLQVKLAVYLGVVLASPVWLFQFWRFLTPGLTRREKRGAYSFTTAAMPLIGLGFGLAYLVFPRAVTLGASFTPSGVENQLPMDPMITFVLRLYLAFGVAFLLPLIFVSLNFAGLIKGRALLGQWRIAVFLIFLFTAIVTPTPDATSMLALAIPMIGLFFIAVAVCLLHDRRLARRAGQDALANLSDDEAAPLESPEELAALESAFSGERAGSIEPAGPIEAPDPLGSSRPTGER